MGTKVSRDLSRPVNNADIVGPEDSHPRLSILRILWHRRRILLVTTVLAVIVGAVYLVVATPIYTSSSNVYIEQTGTKVLADTQTALVKSDSFLHTQAGIMKSSPVLSVALANINCRKMRTFAKINDPVYWLQNSSDFRIEVGKKDDVVTVSLDSPYPQEAADIVNSVIHAYVASQGTHKKSDATEMLKVLQKEKDNRYLELSEKIGVMREFKARNGALSFQVDKGNIILDRLAKLSDSLTDLELQTSQLKSQYDAAKMILNDPVKISAFVENLQTKNSTGDKEYEGMRSEILTYQTTLLTVAQTQGENSLRARTLRGNVQGLQQALMAKERAMAEAYVIFLGQELQAVESNQDKVRAAFVAQQKDALDLNSKAAQYVRLEDDAQRTQKQYGELDNRIKEVTVNSQDSGVTDIHIQVLDVARAEEKPTKPKRSVTLAAALLGGLMLGIGLAVTRDLTDDRVHTPNEVGDTLAVPILGVVTKIAGARTIVARGQNLHLQSNSVVADAYRIIRTSLHFGANTDLKTILITSPCPNDGKSTTTSNLAIALAQAGYRTLVLDADMRDPVQHKIFEISATEGLSSVLQGRKKLREVIQPTKIPRLDVLPCGPIPINPSEIVASNRFIQVMKSLRDGYDHVLIDSPAILRLADARILAASADATVLVLRTNRSTRNESRLALEALYSTGATVIGVIVNAMPRSGVHAYYGRTSSYKTVDKRNSRLIVVQPVEPAESARGQLSKEALSLNGDGAHIAADPAVSATPGVIDMILVETDRGDGNGAPVTDTLVGPLTATRSSTSRRATATDGPV